MLKMKRIFFIGVILLVFIAGCKNNTNQENIEEGITQESLEGVGLCKDYYYIEASNEIYAMLTGNKPASIKRAAFLLEWAFLRGNIEYVEFCNEISVYSQRLKKFISDARISHYRTAGNYALFEFFTKPGWMNDHKPFTYDFEDFTGKEDYTKQFLTKLLRTHTGQCRSLPLLYKILADEIGAEAYLAQAPNHLYIKHLSEENQWVNVELTNGSLSSDAFIISSLGISAEAIRNGVYLYAMDEKETLAFLLQELTHGYQRLFGEDEFVIFCCDTSLEHFPNNMPALFTKHNTSRTIGVEYLNNNSMIPDSTAKALHARWKATQNRIEELGFRDMPDGLYQEWLISLESEKRKQAQSKYLNR